jgi:hypothetical protein
VEVKFFVLLDQQEVHNEQTEHQDECFADCGEKVAFHVKLGKSQFGSSLQFEHLLVRLQKVMRLQNGLRVTVFGQFSDCETMAAANHFVQACAGLLESPHETVDFFRNVRVDAAEDDGAEVSAQESECGETAVSDFVLIPGLPKIPVNGF